jgi:hypothetical protein
VLRGFSEWDHSIDFNRLKGLPAEISETTTFHCSTGSIRTPAKFSGTTEDISILEFPVSGVRCPDSDILEKMRFFSCARVKQPSEIYYVLFFCSNASNAPNEPTIVKDIVGKMPDRGSVGLVVPMPFARSDSSD